MCWRHLLHGICCASAGYRWIAGRRPTHVVRRFTKVPEMRFRFHLLYTQNLAEGREKIADWDPSTRRAFVQGSPSRPGDPSGVYRRRSLDDFFLNEKKFMNGIRRTNRSRANEKLSGGPSSTREKLAKQAPREKCPGPRSALRTRWRPGMNRCR